MSNNKHALTSIQRILGVFNDSNGDIRPHFLLTGPSGSGKTHAIEQLADTLDIPILQINAAQLTKEGTSGNSLSKALSPLMNTGGALTICFVDEFDKLFISGNNNSALAHETTNGVQNEFLTILENAQVSVYGDYGKYLSVDCSNVLFIFAGAFNGEPDISLERLQEFGVKTEFLGRVGLTYQLERLSLADLEYILNNLPLLDAYLKLFPAKKKETVVKTIMETVTDQYQRDPLGARLLSALTHRYFIEGGLGAVKKLKKSATPIRGKLTLPGLH